MNKNKTVSQCLQTRIVKQYKVVSSTMEKAQNMRTQRRSTEPRKEKEHGTPSELKVCMILESPANEIRLPFISISVFLNTLIDPVFYKYDKIRKLPYLMTVMIYSLSKVPLIKP